MSFFWRLVDGVAGIVRDQKGCADCEVLMEPDTEWVPAQAMAYTVWRCPECGTPFTSVQGQKRG